MKMKFKAFIFSLLFGASALLAADPASAMLDIRFRVLGWDLDVADIFYETGGKVRPLLVPSGVRSAFYKYNGPSTLVFFRLKKDEKGNDVRVPAASLDLAPCGKWPLILFTKSGNKQPPEYTLRAIPDDLDSFPASTYEFFNMTRVPVTVKLGADTFTLGAQELKQSKVTLSGGKTTVYASVVYNGPKGPVRVYGNNWACNPTERTVVFVREDPQTPSGATARRVIESAIFPPEPLPATGGIPQ